jgi:type IV secretory pathway TraG/TraD family ATPase VirD4
LAVQWPQAICWLNAGISALVAFVFIRVFNLSLTGAACVFLVVFVVLSLTGSSFGGIWNSGLWTTLPARRCLGAVADAAMFIATAVASWWLVVDVIGVPGLSIRVLTFITRRRPEDVQFVYFVMLIWTGMAFFVPFYGIARYKTLIGKVAAPFARLVRSRFVGMGGSSSFSGLFHDWAHRHRQGQLLLGGSMYSPGWIVGRSDDRHFITVATNRSGKGRSAIIPNLLTWPGSALVIDPKGQNAAVTAAARGHGGGRVKKGMGQSVRIVDPFGELKAQGVDLPAHRFNPLTALDPRRPRCGGANPPADGCARRAGPERQ